MTSKLKAIRNKFREAVDSGRRSGHGWVVMLYYELCEKIWGGSPATQQIEGGLESTEIVPEETLVNDNSPTTPPTQLTTPFTNREDTDIESSETDHNGVTTNNDSDETTTNNQDVIKKRRELLDGKLNTYKHEQMKRKLPVDTQLLSCAQEELAIKKKLVEQMDTFEKQYSETMTKLSDNMEKLTNSISEGFSLLKHFMIPLLPTPYSYQGHHQFPPMYSQSPSNTSYNGVSFPQPYDNPDSP